MFRIKLFIYLTLFLFVASPVYAACGAGSSIGGGQCRVFLTSASSSPFVLPADWTSTNTIEAIGEGGNGRSGTSAASAGGGGAGAYCKISNLSDAANTLENYRNPKCFAKLPLIPKRVSL